MENMCHDPGIFSGSRTDIMTELKDFVQNKKKFILELHDVTPRFSGEVAAMLQLADGLGAAEPVILWTPYWPGRGGKEHDRQFAHTIAARAGEIVLHGYTHHAAGSTWHKIVYGEAVGSEFKHLEKEEAYRLLKEGKSQLEEWSGKAVNWFCAPRWHYGKGTVTALQESGFTGYFEKNRLVFLDGRILPVPVLSFDNGTRRIIDRANRLLRRNRVEKLFACPRLFRLALHPRDMRRPHIKKEIEEIRDRLHNEGWFAVTGLAINSETCDNS